MDTPAKHQGAQEYWRRNLRLMAVPLAIWAAVSFGAGIFFADALNGIKLFGFKLGFWFAQQGSIYVFVALIYYYAWHMNKLERELDVHED
jgi:putative solute:sodium symporter small subunit